VSGHDHDHGAPGHHHHAISADADRGKLKLALALIGTFLIIEFIVAIIARSLALLSDAAHMLTDAGAIALALLAMSLAKRPAQGSYTFGLRRAEILSALVNGVTLLLLGAIFAVQGVRHVINPPDVVGGLVLGVAVVGIVVNLVATAVLAQANRQSLNVEGAYQHILTDLFAFIATAVAGAVILLTGWYQADGLAALLVAALMLHSGWGLVRESGRVLLEAAPRGTDVGEIGMSMAALSSVVEVHDLHVWELSTGSAALAAHVTVASHDDCHRTRLDLQRLLRERFAIEHTTLQVDHVADELVQINDRRGSVRG
jgi:cobalt-zinc-cadmium efflux system protein